MDNINFSDISIITGCDWQGIYVDKKLIAQCHGFNFFDISYELRNYNVLLNSVEGYCLNEDGEDMAEYYGCFLDNFDDMKKYIKL